MENLRKTGAFLAAAVFAALVLVFPGKALLSARDAMAVWVSSVAPALFPFMALMPVLSGGTACRVYGKVFGRAVHWLFRLPEEAAAALVTGIAAGSPTGAMAAVRVAKEAGFARGEAKRLGLMLTGVGPAYLLTGVGVGLFGSAKIGAWLFLGQLAAQFLTGLVLRNAFRDETESVSGGWEMQGGGILQACMALLQVCGNMMFFSVLAGVLGRVFGAENEKNILYILDLPGGMAALAEEGGGLVTAGMMTGFGGLCIAAQNMRVLKVLGVRWKEYICVKCLNALVCAGVVAAGSVTTMGVETAARGSGTLEIAALSAVFLMIPAIFLKKKSNS